MKVALRQGAVTGHKELIQMKPCARAKKLTRLVSFMILVCLCVPMLSFAAFAVDNLPQDDAMVKNITVRNGYFVNDFDSDVFHYEVYLESYSYDDFISVELTDSRFEYTINGTENITDSPDGNLITVSVFDPRGVYESAVYYLTVYVGADAQTALEWKGLTYLDVENGIFSPQFSRYRTTYYAILENNIDRFDAAGVRYSTVNPDAAVAVECRGLLNEDGTIPEGKRVQYTITVTEADGTVKTYSLNLYRKAAVAAAINDEAKLANITINGGAVTLSGFSAHRASYDIKVPASVNELTVQAYPADRSQIVQVLGPTAMNADGPVFINILVTSSVSDVCSIYTLRLEYDSFMHTERYTSFQMLTCILLSGAVCLCAGFICGRKYKKSLRREPCTTPPSDEQKG